MATLTQPQNQEYNPYNERQYIGGSEVVDSSQPPLLQMPGSGTAYANQDDVFIKWLFDHKSKTIPALEMAWRGLKWSSQENKYVKIGNLSGDEGRVMNEAGINWCSSLLESYFSPVFLATNLSVRNYNFRMRNVSRSILMNLFERYKEFGLRQSDIDRVAEEVESKISALLAGAINDGYRRWLSTQTHITEQKVYGVPAPQGGIQSIFSRNSNNQQQGGSY